MSVWLDPIFADTKPEGALQAGFAETDITPKVDGKTPVYRAEVRIGAQEIGWDRRKPRGQNGKGPIKRGFGMGHRHG